MYHNPKNNLIEKIRKSSLIIGILCVIGTLSNTFLFIMNVFGPDHGSVKITGTVTARILCSTYLSIAADAVIMLVSAVLFFSMSRSGRPFTPKKIRVVLLIAVLLLLKTAVSNLIYGISLDIELHKVLAMVLMRGGWMEGILFLFAALIMYYASFLQQESDETL